MKHKLLLIKDMFFYVLKSVYRQLQLDIPRHVATYICLHTVVIGILFYACLLLR